MTSHAACKGHAPENTLAGIAKAIELEADAIEVDVRCTLDGVPVLLHDEVVDRTTDGAGAVQQLSLAELRKLDAGARQFVPRFRWERVPTLLEALELTRGHALLQIEIKQANIECHVADAVRSLSAVSDCEVHSFSPHMVKRMREVEPRMAAALLTDGRGVVDWADLYGFALSLNAQGVSVFHEAVTPERTRQGQLRSLTFMTWTVDDAAEMERMLTAGVDSICTNFPDIGRGVVDGVATTGG